MPDYWNPFPEIGFHDLMHLREPDCRDGGINPMLDFRGLGDDFAVNKYQVINPSAPWLLVVEDNSAVRGIYADILRGMGYLFDLAEDGEHGWENIQNRVYSVIVTDHDMPRLTGLGLIKRLDEADYRVPVLLISGSILPSDTRLAGLCLLEMIPKPVSVEEVVVKIRDALSLDLPAWYTQPWLLQKDQR